MCGDGYASPLLIHQNSLRLRLDCGAAQPQKSGKNQRKGTAFPHIRRHSRKEIQFSKA
jgi:hypothetical protein